MFKKWQEKWKVGPWQLFLIICTFAVTGTLTAWISRQATTWTGMDADSPWALKLLLRLGILVFGYQVIILAVSFLFGQFPFFWNYEKKILRRFGLIKPEKDGAKDFVK
jgi:hypothetical protein